MASGTTSLGRVEQSPAARSSVSVVTWADCLVALQQREVDAISTDDAILAGLMTQDPYLHIVGPEHGAEPVRHRDQPRQHPLVRFVNGTLERIRARWHVEHAVPQMVNRPGARSAPPAPRYVD